MEHSPLALDRVYELVFATQRMGMAALVRLPDQLGTPVQPLLDYLKRGDEQCLRMIQLEDWATLEAASRFAQLQHVNGLFVGLGDLFLSSGKAASARRQHDVDHDLIR